MKHRVVISGQAFRDLEEIAHFIEAERSTAGAAFLLRMEKRIQRLAFFPLIGTIPLDEGLSIRRFRQLLVEEYLVFYKITGKLIRVHRVIHGRRDYPQLF